MATTSGAKLMMRNHLRILYLAAQGTNTLKRVNALRRLGHEVTQIDPYSFFPYKDFVGRLIYYAGASLIEIYLKYKISPIITKDRFDVSFVDGGELIGPNLIKVLRKVSPIIINYNNDDPFGGRDKKKWRLYREAVPHYDLLAVVRPVNVAEAYALGAPKVLQVFMAVDELDGPREITPQDRRRFPHEVLFIGTWMPERGPFLQELMKAGVPLAIYGNDWQKAPEWPALQSAWHGPAIYGDDYLKAIQLAKVSLGLLSKGNRDLHTTRTFEIPYCGGLLCAERTSEHLQLYQEDVEAVYWGDVEECIEKCRKLLNDDKMRAEIAEKGRIRCLSNGIFNEKNLKNILATALS
ncbi:MAG: glycosyltransferase family 1 protein [Deltaproteobacteria bacterium]|nr:MAG: glycosyltransferase family 1 protein [Deltaproteobacteria bacterium]